MSLKKIVRMAKMNGRITPKLQGWLVNNGQVTISSDAVAERVMEILKPEVSKSRAGAFHPSQLYSCPRAQVFGYHDAPAIRRFDPTLQNLFNDGHFRHLRWQIMLLEAGILTDIEVPVALPKYRLTGSMDGMNSGEGWMFELKGTSQFRTIQMKGVLPAHRKQVNAYLLASGLDEAVIVYECKSTQQWIETQVVKDEHTIAEITAILEVLNEAIEGDFLPPRLEECEGQSGATYNSCAYAETCFGCRKPSDIALLQVERRNPASS
jgi:hypothetical protein